MFWILGGGVSARIPLWPALTRLEVVSCERRCSRTRNQQRHDFVQTMSPSPPNLCAFASLREFFLSARPPTLQTRIGSRDLRTCAQTLRLAQPQSCRSVQSANECWLLESYNRTWPGWLPIGR